MKALLSFDLQQHTAVLTVKYNFIVQIQPLSLAINHFIMLTMFITKGFTCLTTPRVSNCVPLICHIKPEIIKNTKLLIMKQWSKHGMHNEMICDEESLVIFDGKNVSLLQRTWARIHI